MATEQKSSNALAVFRDLIERQTAQFLAAMRDDEKAVSRFKRILMTMYQERKEVRECDPMSILQVAMRAAQDGLMLDGVEAAVVPFKDRDAPGKVTATYIPMIQGIRKKVRNSGLVADWIVRPVYEGDDFIISFGSNEFIRHQPSLTGGRKRPLIGCYSIATFKDGSRSYAFMNKDEIEDIRSKSKARSGPWHDPIFYPEMACKTLARNHSKQLPMSSDMQVFWQNDDRDSGAVPPRTIEGSATRELTGSSHAAAASVADMLDDFGAGAPAQAAQKSLPPADTPSQPPPGADGGAASPQPSGARGLTSADIDSVKKAYRRGQEDRKAGKPDAVPTDYATNDKNKEQIAWAAGFDGKAMPEWRIGS